MIRWWWCSLCCCNFSSFKVSFYAQLLLEWSFWFHDCWMLQMMYVQLFQIIHSYFYNYSKVSQYNTNTIAIQILDILLVVGNVPSNCLKSVCAQNFLCATFYWHWTIFRTPCMKYVQTHFLTENLCTPCFLVCAHLTTSVLALSLEGTLIFITIVYYCYCC